MVYTVGADAIKMMHLSCLGHVLAFNARFLASVLTQLGSGLCMESRYCSLDLKPFSLNAVATDKTEE
jgi:hypothetical protein